MAVFLGLITQILHAALILAAAPLVRVDASPKRTTRRFSCSTTQRNPEASTKAPAG
jgi:hypothetical protein